MYEILQTKRTASGAMMQQILKRLELIKTSIAIEDEEIIELQVAKLSTMQIDEDMQTILRHLSNQEYTRAVLKIDMFIDQHKKRMYGNYVVSFVDILGQKQELKKIEQIILDKRNENSTENLKLIQDTFNRTYKPIQVLREAFREEYYSFLNQDETTNEASIHTFNPLHMHSFSDFVMSYISFENTDKALKVQGVYYLIFSISIVFLKMLSSGIVFRGGVDLGIGMEISSNELYGSALSNAYKLECEVAEYPRLVVGNNLVKFLKNAINGDAKHEADKMDNKFAKICLKVIAKDTDGVYIINYLGQSFQDSHGMDFDQIKKQAYVALMDKYKEQLNSDNAKLSERYHRAIRYFENNGVNA